MGGHVQSLAEHDSKIGHRYVVKPCVSFIAFIMLNCYSVTDFILAGDFGTVNFFAFCSDHQDPSIVCWKAILIMHFDAHNVLRFGFCAIQFLFPNNYQQLSTKNLSEYLLIGRAWGYSIIQR